MLMDKLFRITMDKLLVEVEKLQKVSSKYIWET